MPAGKSAKDPQSEVLIQRNAAIGFQQLNVAQALPILVKVGIPIGEVLLLG